MCNYRHPGPRRVWKGGLDLQLPPPTFAGSGGSTGSGGSGGEFREACFCAQAWWFSNIYSENGVPTSQSAPRVSQDLPRHPKAAQSDPPHPPRAPKGIPRRPKVTPQTPQRTPKGTPSSQTLYKQTPDQPQSSRHVSWMSV